MLYISPLFVLDNPRNSFGYADDVAILETSSSLDTNANKIGTAINQVVPWNPARPYLKWLGVHFDRKLSFKHHAQIQTAKALKVARAISCLGNTISAVPPHLSRQAAVAYLLPIAHFAAETWWSGRTRKKGWKTVSNRVGGHLAVLDKLYSTVARAILPAYRTTPRAALLREAGLQPAELAPETISIRAVIRTRRLDSRHPLFVRGQDSTRLAALSRFSRLIKDIPLSDRIDPLRLPHRAIKESEQGSLARIGFTSELKELRVINFREFAQSLLRNDVTARHSAPS
ncbi:hypothetical protein K3495_g3743 [Podosphaera aphanis]|nr:hypothetical protein K3495_g3743 [Podosphaera aphanis]